jgi:hypothetical protein
MERSRIELRRKALYVVPRDLTFLTLETHSQTKIVKPPDHLSFPLSHEPHNREKSIRSIKFGNRTAAHRNGCSPPLFI